METCLTQACASAVGGASTSIFAQLLQTLLVAQCGLSKDSDYPPDRTSEILSNLEESYDFVIVGGGSAGSVVASRLSENPNWKILLIEAGENPSAMSGVPGLVFTLEGTKEDYSYDVEPQENCCQGTKNKRCKWAKGKALGGSSVINAMIHVNGNDRDYDEWARKGNPGWSFEEVLPYFKKSVNYPAELIAKQGSRYFGSGGPLNIQTYNYTDMGEEDLLLEAVQELGIPILDPMNAGRNIGFGKAYVTIENKMRINVAEAFLSPAKDRRNLYVLRSSRAEKIVFDGNQAKGVVVKLASGQKITVKASKEVVLSAGSVESPHLLMLSGIGPKEHLEEFGIDVLADLPVGQGLRDHLIWIGLQLEFVNSSLRALPPTWLLDEAYKYLMHRTGEFTSVGGIDLLGFLNLNEPGSEYPDVEFHHMFVPRGQLLRVQAMMQAFNIDEEISEVARQATLRSDIIWPCPIILRPKSRGELKLRSSDPDEAIRIYANYFAEDEDAETMLKSVDFAKKLVNTETMKKLGMKLRHFEIPGCSDAKFDTREYWKCNLRHLSSTIYHPVGTARMGPSDDPAAVVDPRLRVHEIRYLRVIDASIMPDIPSGNIHSATLMIAEKASDMIKEDWSTKDEL